MHSGARRPLFSELTKQVFIWGPSWTTTAPRPERSSGKGVVEEEEIRNSDSDDFFCTSFTATLNSGRGLQGSEPSRVSGALRNLPSALETLPGRSQLRPSHPSGMGEETREHFERQHARKARLRATSRSRGGPPFPAAAPGPPAGPGQASNPLTWARAAVR